MTKNGLDIQTISTKRTDKQADRVLLLGQLTEKKEKDNPSHFLKFLFADPHCTHLVAAPPSNPTQSSHQKSAIFANALFDKGFRAAGDFQREIELTYRLKLLLCELKN